MALVQSISIIPTTTTVVASSLDGLCSTAEVPSGIRVAECTCIGSTERSRWRKRAGRSEVLPPQKAARFGESSSPQVGSEVITASLSPRDKASELDQGHRENQGRQITTTKFDLPESTAMNIHDHQNMNMLIPFGSLTPDAWHSALAKGNIPKETIIAHTDFTTTSAIAKRRLQKQQKLLSQRRSSSSTGEGVSEDEDQSSRGSGKSPLQPIAPPAGGPALPHHNHILASSKDLSVTGVTSMDHVTAGRTSTHSMSQSVSSSLASPDQMQSMLALQQAHLAQQMGTGGVFVSGSCVNGLGDVPVFHSHNHTHAHMHHFTGPWPAPLVPYPPSYVGKPRVSSDNRVVVHPVQQPNGYHMVYMVPGPFVAPPTMSMTGTSSQMVPIQSLPSTGEASSSAAFPMGMGNPLVQAPGPQMMPWPALPTSSQAQIPVMTTGGIPVINGIPMVLPGFMSAGPYVHPMTVAATSNQTMVGAHTQHCLGN